MKKNSSNEEQMIQWHPAFYAGMQIELSEYADYLEFENEHQLSSKPLGLDVLIIKNDKGLRINKNIGRIFRKHNIIEYKSPTDYISIDDYYKVLSYAYLYKSESQPADSIKIDDITISIVVPHYPRKLMSHLEDTYGYRVDEVDNGIYYLKKENSLLPTQFIVTSKLDYDTNMWIAGLTNDLTDYNKAERMLQEYKKNSGNTLYESVVTVVVNANPIFNGGDIVMYKSMDEYFNDVFQHVVAMKDSEIAEKDNVIAEKDNEIAQLKKQIAEMSKIVTAN
jgi:hypothetical protein